MSGDSERLRLCHVTLGLDVGGQEQALVGLTENLDPSRFDVTVVSMTSRGALSARLERAGARVVALEQPGGVRPLIVLALARLFRRHRFSIVHTHDDRPLAYATPAALLAGVPFRVHTHHHGEWGRLSSASRLWLGLSARLVDRFICVSQECVNYLQEQRIALRPPEVVSNGVDLRLFPFHGPAPGGPLVCVARLSREKGHRTLLMAFREVAGRWRDLELWLAGSGPEFGDLTEYARNLGIGERVRFLGNVQDVPALLKEAALFVLASTTEGLPLTLLEAMATGLPVIATNVGGNPSVVETSTNGILVPPEDPHRLAQAICELIGDEQGAKRLGLAARHRVEQRFSLAAVARQYETIYDALARPAPQPQGPFWGRLRC